MEIYIKCCLVNCCNYCFSDNYFNDDEIVKNEVDVDVIDGNVFTSSITIVKDRTMKLIESIDSENPPFVCEICSKLFSDIIKFKSHMTYHIRRNFKCKYCRNGFKHIINLKKHIKKHVEIYNSKCMICHKKFVDENSMWNHIVHVHKIEEPYKCGACLKLFTNKRYLRKHVVRHMNQNSCGTCIVCKIHSSNFLSSNSKLTNCLFCDKKFAILKNLRKHMYRDHGYESPYECDMCYKLFPNITDFKIHMINNYIKNGIYCKRCHNK